MLAGGTGGRAACREPHSVPGAGAAEQRGLPGEGLRQGRGAVLRGAPARPQQPCALLQPVGGAPQDGPVRRGASRRSARS